MAAILNVKITRSKANSDLEGQVKVHPNKSQVLQSSAPTNGAIGVFKGGAI